MRTSARVVWPLRGVLHVATADDAGGVLADLVVGRISAPQGRVFASPVRRKLTWPVPSELATNDGVAEALWRDSAALAGLSQRQAPRERASGKVRAYRRTTSLFDAIFACRLPAVSVAYTRNV